VRRLWVLTLLVSLGASACSDEAAKLRHVEKGQRFFEAGRLQEAIIEFRNAVARDELWGEARFKLAEAYAANGDQERAYGEFVRAADLMPENADAQIKAVTYLLLVGQNEDARTRIQRLLEREPKNVEAQILLGNALAGLRDLDGAVTQITEAIAIEPGRSQSYSNLALIKIAQGRVGEASAAFDKAVQTDPTSVRARLALANFHWSIGDVAAAEQALKTAYSLDPGDIVTNRAMAALYVATGRGVQAEAHLKFVAEHSQTAASRFSLADYYIANRRDDEARRILDPMVLDSTAVFGAELRLAGLAYSTGDTAEGHRRLDALLLKEPSFAAGLLMKARWLLAEGNRESALATATAAVAADPGNTVAFYVRGLAEMSAHRSQEALKSFSEVLRLNPRATIAQVQLSRLYLQRNALESAVLYAEEAVSNAPGSIDARLALIRAWIARGDHARAQQALDNLKKQAPTLGAVSALDGSLQLILGNRPAARAAFERALKLDGVSMEALTGIVSLDITQGDIATAVTRIDAVLATGTESPDILLLAGRVYLAAQQNERAERLLRRASDLDPLNLESFSLLGQLYARQNRLAAMRAEFDAIASATPKNLAPRLMAAMIVHAQGDVKDARSRYSQILQLEPRAALAANNLAVLHSEEGGDLELAQQLAERAAEQMPAHPEIQDTLGMIYMKRQQLGQAVRRFEQSVAVNPENPVYHYHLGLAYSKSGDIERARRSLQAALKLQPAFGDARQALDTLPN
jgi:putative PEP-CTERM system TPR-repeat lipoprotein